MVLNRFVRLCFRWWVVIWTSWLLAIPFIEHGFSKASFMALLSLLSNFIWGAVLALEAYIYYKERFERAADRAAAPSKTFFQHFKKL